MKVLVDEVPRVEVDVLRAYGVAQLAREVELRLAVGDTAGPRIVSVKLAWSRMPHGGYRPSWICPACGARRRILHVQGPGARLACRQDLDLRYRTSRDHRTRHHELVVRPLMSRARAARTVGVAGR